MVAAGGGGAYHYELDTQYSNNGGSAGNLKGFSGENNGSCIPLGGTQIEAGSCSSNSSSDGSFGKGGNGVGPLASGGGSGYYGASGCYDPGSVSSGGGGGSSYISGYKGCVAIKSLQDTTPKCGESEAIGNIECSYHYSTKIFISSIMKSGNEMMPTIDGTGTENGHSGNGYAKITYIGS